MVGGKAFVLPSAPTLPSKEGAVVSSRLVPAGVGCKGKMSVCQQARLEAERPAEREPGRWHSFCAKVGLKAAAQWQGPKYKKRWSSACQVGECCFLPPRSSTLLLAALKPHLRDSSRDGVVWSLLARLCSLPSSLLWLLLVRTGRTSFELCGAWF